MNETEFIIALTEHRFLGHIFIPYLIRKSGPYYTVLSHVKPRDFKTISDYQFKPWEIELVNIIEKYSDEKLVKKFSRAGNVTEFYSSLKPGSFQKQITPFIEKCMFQVAEILMLSPVRLINKEAKYANLYDEDEVEVPPIFAHAEMHFDRKKDNTEYRLKVFHDNREISLQNPNIKVITNDPCMLIYKGKLLVFEALNAKKLLPFFEKNVVIIPHAMEKKYYSGFVLNAIRDYNVKASGFTIEDTITEKKAILSLEKNLQQQPVFVLQFNYGNDKFLHNSKRKIAVSFQKKDNHWIFKKTIREFEWESEILEYLFLLGLKEENGNFSPKGLHLLNNTDSLYYLVEWLNKNNVDLRSKGIELAQDKQDKTFFTGNSSIDIKTQKKGDWFDVYASVKFGEFNIPFIKLKKYILNGIREFELPNGEIAVLPEEWFARFKGLIPFAKLLGNKLELEKHHFTLLKNQIQGIDKSLMQKLQELEIPENDSLVLPVNLKAKLRAYQVDGFRWMFHLHKNNFGGCLADDMGLGKTLQTLSLLLKLKRLKKEIVVRNPLSEENQLNLFEEDVIPQEIQPASLIVLPTSLVHNWDNEIRKFTPSLKAYKHLGIQRKKAIDLQRISEYYDVILTTYGTVRNDIGLLKHTNFFYIILDESQYIKNPTSKTYKAVTQLNAQNRLVLTGTPIENSLMDLWSQMNFLNPGLLGNLAFFKRTFHTPIEKHGNLEQQEKLQLMIRPFILRRKKNEVAKDLPPLMEQVQFCEMTKEQHKKYEHEKSLIRNAILESIENEGMEKSSFVILQGLTKLRQLANHPLLVDEETTIESGKFQEIFRALESLMAENHKVLIFSSFVKHLELLQKRIEQENWKYSKLTGQSVKREKIIKEFQEEKENRIFLISLKAGGVGLNLTKADYVFIIDPWWNPAAENQAINRAHRIGQDKHVFVYRFITENSIEEKIQQLKERKSSLADKFIHSNNPFQKITKEEIVEMFE